MRMIIILALIYMIALPIYLTILIVKPNLLTPKKDEKTSKRTHERIAPTSLISPLNPYEKYQDKKSGLYIPIKNNDTRKSEVHK